VKILIRTARCKNYA